MTDVHGPSTATPYVDLAFPAVGDTVPLDHGYVLFAAICRRLPLLREKSTWSVHPIRGVRGEPGVLGLQGRARSRSTVKLRLPAGDIGKALLLAGAQLELDGHRITLGAPTVHALGPSPVLRARIVTIRGFFADPAAFTDALLRQLGKLPGLDKDPERIAVEVAERRVMRIRDRIVVGFRVELARLTDAASLAVQAQGLGGRRHMGAGVFVPPPNLRGRT